MRYKDTVEQHAQKIQKHTHATKTGTDQTRVSLLLRTNRLMTTTHQLEAKSEFQEQTPMQWRNLGLQ
jgi:hypothetical protein